MEKNTLSPLAVISVAIFSSAFLFIFLFVNRQQDKYGYLLHIYGADNLPGSVALVKVMSKDGEVVSNPEIAINDKVVPTSLIELRPDIKKISVKQGKLELNFPVRFSDIENSRVIPSETVRFSSKDLENKIKPGVIDGKKIFLLPDQFRVVPEFETDVHLFCLNGKEPCKEHEVTINGIKKEMFKGHLVFKTVFTREKHLLISIGESESVKAEIPYSGRMLRFYPQEKSITLAALSGVRNVHVDCFSQDKWIGTDIVSVPREGLVLPDAYLNCETVQASFNSASPGTTFAVYSRSYNLKGMIDDPYYSEIAPHLDKFSNKAVNSFIKNYNSSFFKPLSLVFSGEKLEKEFDREKQKDLQFYWWMLLISGLAGLAVFVGTALKKMKIVEGIDGELISQSMAKQRAMLAGATVIYIAFLISLLYLFKNLA